MVSYIENGSGDLAAFLQVEKDRRVALTATSAGRTSLPTADTAPQAAAF